MTQTAIVHGQVAGQNNQHVTAPIQVDTDGKLVVTLDGSTSATTTLSGSTVSSDGSIAAGAKTFVVEVLTGTLSIMGRTITSSDDPLSYSGDPTANAVAYVFTVAGTAHIAEGR